MIESIIEKLLRFYKKLVYSIAFIPTLMIVFSLVLGLFMFDLETTGFASELRDSLRLLLVLGADNARLILTTIIGGIISLTVFSFSMVMVVLNRTSASLSPRVLPQLVAQKFHQLVLGFYMGTIVFSLILVNNVDSDENLPSLGILLSMILAILSLGLFIYFIHSISQSIQVDNILKDILFKTKRQIETIKKRKTADLEPNEQSKPFWQNAVIAKTGHYKIVELQSLCKILAKNDLILRTCIHSGEFVIENTVLAQVNKQNTSEEIIKKIENSFYFTANADNEHQYYFGLRKISEIAVKAMSPGINDPGTAVRSVRYLSILFSDIIDLDDYIIYTDNNKKTRIYQKLPDLDNLIFECIAPIRNFSSTSLEVHAALYDFFLVLLLKQKTNKALKTIKKHLLAQISTSDNNLNSANDRENINKYIKKIQNLQLKGLSTLPKLSAVEPQKNNV